MRLALPEPAPVLTYSLPSRTTYQTGVVTGSPLLRNVARLAFLYPFSFGKGLVDRASVKDSPILPGLSRLVPCITRRLARRIAGEARLFGQTPVNRILGRW